MNKKHKLLHRDNEYITSKLEIIYEEDIQRIVEERNNLQSKIDKANGLLRLLHYKFKDEDSIHNEIEDIQRVLKENK